MFGAAPAKKEAVSFDELTNRMDGRVEQLDNKIMNIDMQLRVLRERMKSARGGTLESTRQQALRLMKQKKMYERQRDQLMGTAFTVSQASFALDTVRDAQDTVNALQAGAQQLRAANRQLRIGDIDVCSLQNPPFDMTSSSLILCLIPFTKTHHFPARSRRTCGPHGHDGGDQRRARCEHRPGRL